jgi:hypothetical protein
MIKVYERLYIGNIADCRQGSKTLTVVHACKSPCHQQSVGYKGSLSPAHPNYLVLRTPYDLFLNIIDPPVPLFKIETFIQFFLFMSEHYDGGGSMLIHCNQGESRAPTLALLYLAKHLRVIPDRSFLEAKEAFAALYAGYGPGAGIQQFLTVNWGRIGSGE